VTPRPWYRQPWPWFLIAIPLLGIVLSSITVATAILTADPDVAQAHAPLSKTSWTSSSDTQEAVDE
jgi:hypothetical protein